MVLLSQNFTPQPPPQPLGPIPSGCRRVVFTSSYNIADKLCVSKDEIRDVLTATAEEYVRNGMALMFDDRPEEKPEIEPLKCPYTNAPKRAWVEYAVQEGADPLEASEMTKAQLQNTYGERL